MPASHAAIAKNIERLKDQALIDLWNQEATEGRTPGQAWAAFIEAADELRLADRIPGSVGRSFRAKYAEDKSANDTVKPARALAPKPGSKAPLTRTAASRPTPAATGSTAGGSRQRRSKAAQAAQKEAAK